MGTYNYGTSDRIGEAGGFYVEDYGALSEVKIINTPINSYRIAKNAVNLQKYQFNNVAWEATELDTKYCLRPNDDNLDSTKIPTYYIHTPEGYVLWEQENYPDPAEG
jgi:hypothetical protein